MGRLRSVQLGMVLRLRCDSVIFAPRALRSDCPLCVTETADPLKSSDGVKTPRLLVCVVALGWQSPAADDSCVGDGQCFAR